MSDNEKIEKTSADAQAASKPAKAEKKAKKDEKPGFFQRVARWFREMKSELKKVVWPTPKQTINNLIRALQAKGYLTLAPNASNRQERILTLTESGLRYAESILLPLLALEESAICAMGAEAVRQMVDMALRYGAILEKAMREASYGKA